MASKVRIVTINRGEEAVVRVNSLLPITLEFPGWLVSVYERNGLVFQRMERQGVVDAEGETQEDDEIEADDMEETQRMDEEVIEETQVFTQLDETPPPSPAKVSPPILLRNLNLRSRRVSLYRDIHDLNKDLFN